MIVYGIKTCDTCRKALKSLPGARLHDLRSEGVPEEVAQAALAAFGAALVNRKSATWRALGEADRARDPLSLIAAHPAVMKRPLIDSGGTLYLGWGREVQDALLG
jgi:arsenate reductase-like glutaredoxin family protein